MYAVVPVRRPRAADRPACVESIGPRSKKAISFGCVGVGPVEHRDAALVPRLHHDVAAGNRDQRAVVRDAVLQRASARAGIL